LIAVVLRMTMPLVEKRDVTAMVILAAIFVAIGCLRLPLPAVLLVAVPASLLITWFMRRRMAS
jgi:chromate transporter